MKACQGLTMHLSIERGCYQGQRKKINSFDKRMEGNFPTFLNDMTTDRPTNQQRSESCIQLKNLKFLRLLVFLEKIMMGE